MADPYFLDMEKPVIVYDGECRFCQWSVERIRKRDRRDHFEYLPRQTAGIDERFPILARSDFDAGLRLMRSANDVIVGADAIYQIYRRLPPYHLVAWTYRLPVLKSLARMGYQFIARNRHLFGRVQCDSEACALPPHLQS